MNGHNDGFRIETLILVSDFRIQISGIGDADEQA